MLGNALAKAGQALGLGSREEPAQEPTNDWPAISVLDKAARCFELRAQIAALEAELKPLEAQIKETVPPGEKVITPAGSVLVTESQTVKVSDVDALKKALGEGFPQLVDIAVTYKPTEALKGMACDGNSPLAEHLREGLSVSTTRSLRYSDRKAA